MTAYTNFLKLRAQAFNASSWDVMLNQNLSIIDFVAGPQNSTNRLISGGLVTAGAGLNASHALALVIVSGMRYEVAAGSVAVAGSSLNYIYINSSGTVISATTPPTGDYVPLAVADAGAAAVDRIGDCRPQAPVVVPTNNVFINGDFAIDQENAGSAVSVSTADKYFVDMFKAAGANHTAVVNAQRVAGFGGFSYAGKITVTTADTLSSGKYGHGIRTFIEYRNCQLIAGRYLAFSFKFKAKLAGTYSVALQSSDVSNSYVTTFIYSVAEAVQVVSMLIPVPSTKVIDGNNNRGLNLDIGRAAVGTYATATLNQWQAGNYIAASGGTDWEVTVGNYIAVTGIHGGPDLIPAEFPYLDHGAELMRCQRYLQIFGNAGANHISGSGVMTGATSAYIALPLTVQLRGVPTVTASNIGSCYIRQNNANLVASAIAFGLLDANHADIVFTVSGGTTYAPAALNIYGTIKLDARM